MFKVSLPRIVLAVLITPVSLVGLYHTIFLGRIYPGVHVAGVNLSGKTAKQAEEKIASLVQTPNITLVFPEKEFAHTADNLEIKYKPQESVQAAYSTGRGFSLASQKQTLTALFKGVNLPLSYTLKQEALEEKITEIAQQIEVPEEKPEAHLEKRAVVINKGQDGLKVNTSFLKDQIEEVIKTATNTTIEIPTRQIIVTLSESEIEQLKQRAQNLLGKKLVLTLKTSDNPKENETYTYKDKDTIPLLTPSGLKEEKIQTVSEDLAKIVSRTPQDGRFAFEQGRVKEFTPGKNGVELQKEKLQEIVKQSIELLIQNNQAQLEADIPVNLTSPQIKTEDANTFGINELIGRGTSFFKSSIASRIHNITLATNRINGILIKPGETFSFNNALGDVSAYTGFQQAYVIKEGKTVLGDGGGVCQVSTTLFRSALNAGLPIMQRQSHSYRVGYYEQDSKPGIDATVYAPGVDLKVKNDTGAHILIQAKVDRKKSALTIELYGTSDTRVAEISTPEISDIQPAPPPLYQDDPTLPTGTTKQIDYQAQGAKVKFYYKVTKGEETILQKTFYSNYQPWQAVYLRGTAPN